MLPLKPLQAWLPREQRAEFIRLVQLFFAAAAGARLWLSHQLDAVWALPVYGLAGDFIAAVFMASCVVVCHGWHRAAAVAAIILWALLGIASGEHLYALDAPLRLENYRFALDATFIQGSFFNLISWPAAALTAGIAAHACRRVWRMPAANTAALLLALALLLSSAAVSWRFALAAPDWRAASPLAMIFSRQAGQYAGDAVNADVFFQDEVARGAAAAFDEKPDRPNILIVFLEGLPGVYMRQVSQYSGVSPAITMPHLSDIAEEAYLAPNFIAHSSGTIGGLYASLCGDYSFSGSDETIKPFLLSSLPASARPRCLPQALRDSGYETVFMQAADLNYMSKNDIMPIIGFDEVLGKQEGDNQAGNFWGVDDGALFARAADKIAALQAGDRPWFLSLLTVGTHHPFLAPPEYRERYGSAKEAAVRYLDDSLAEFIARLRAQGVFEDTLVILTGDESHGVPGHPFSANWGVFAALGAGVRPQLAEGIFGQIDISASLLDYLNLPEQAPQRIGRSIFRRYDDKRSILFGDYALHDGIAHRCPGDGSCRQYPIVNEKLFAPSYRATFAGGGEALYFSAFAQAGNFYGRGERNQLLLAQNIEWDGVRENIGQIVNIPAQSRIEVILDADSLATDGKWLPSPRMQWLDGSESGRAEAGGFLFQLPALPPDSGMRLHYSFYNEAQREARFLFSAFARTGGLNGVRINKIAILATPVQAPVQDVIQKFELFWGEAAGSQMARLFPKYNVDSGGGRTPNFVAHTLMPGGRAAFAPHYAPGQQLVFNDLNEWQSLLYLAGDWNYPGEQGVQSDGALPALAFRLAEIDPAAKYEIILDIQPHTAPPVLSERKLSFLINGEKIGAQTFTDSELTRGALAVAGDLLKANAVNVFAVEVHQPFVPAKYNVDVRDRAQRGFTLTGFQLRPAR